MGDNPFETEVNAYAIAIGIAYLFRFSIYKFNISGCLNVVNKKFYIKLKFYYICCFYIYITIIPVLIKKFINKKRSKNEKIKLD